MYRRVALMPGLVLAVVFLIVPVARGSGVQPAPSAAPTPLGTAFTYQGEIKQSGAPVNATCDFQFTAFDAASGGSQVGTTQAVNAIPVTNGLFTAYPIDFGASAYTNSLWVQVAAACPGVSGTFPLQRLTPAPNAVFATTASSATSATSAASATNFTGSLAGDVSGAQSSTVVGALQGRAVASTAPTSGQILKFNGSQWAPGTDNDTTYSAGTGLSLSGTQFQMSFGGNGSNNTAAHSDHTHLGQTWITGSGNALSITDTDVNAIALDLVSQGTSFNAAALSAQVLRTTGQSVGILGGTNSTDANAAGVLGQALSSGSAKGVWGQAVGANTTGIYGVGSGSNSWAGYFDGSVHVNGTFSKAAGSFKIDDPLDPANKYLYHSFVESPDMMNVYNGNVALDANGQAWVSLPAWFETLNVEYRYQLTPIGGAAPGLHVAQEVQGNRFQIGGGTPGLKVSWQVTGIRNDPYAQQHRIPVEEAKPPGERGMYLYPEGYGQPAPARNTVPAVAPNAGAGTGRAGAPH